MKFNTKYFISLFTTAFTVVNGSPASSGFSEACITEMTNMEKCISQKITKENLNIVCEASKSPDCQEFYSNPMSFLPSCQNFNELITTSSQIFNNSLSLMCETDESGNICPFTEYELTTSNGGMIGSNNLNPNGETNPIDNNTINNNDAMNAVKNTCSSAKCKAATQKYIQFIIDSNNDVTKTIAANYKFAALQNANTEVVNELKSFLDILNGNECTPTTGNLLTNSIANNTAVPGNNTLQANQMKSENSYAITKYITKPMFIVSFVIYMALYCLMFKFILI